MWIELGRKDVKLGDELPDWYIDKDTRIRSGAILVDRVIRRDGERKAKYD